MQSKLIRYFCPGCNQAILITEKRQAVIIANKVKPMCDACEEISFNQDFRQGKAVCKPIRNTLTIRQKLSLRKTRS
jgi:RNase P subunit RPR2